MGGIFREAALRVGRMAVDYMRFKPDSDVVTLLVRPLAKKRGLEASEFRNPKRADTFK